MSQPNAIVTGLKCRCPRCGKGRLFTGYLRSSPACEACGLDYGFADSGDGPAVFVIFLVAPLVVIMAVIVGSIWTLEPWVHLLLWLPTAVVLSLLLLPPFKGVLINLQFQNDAREGRL